MKKHSALALSVVALSACALKGDVRRVELQLEEMRAEAARADSVESVRADELNTRIEALLRLQRAVLDSIDDLDARVTSFAGDNRTDHTAIERQLVQIQELTGQSQARLSDLGSRLRNRESQPPGGPSAPGSVNDSSTPAPVSGSTEAREVYDVSLQQLRRSSAVTARDGFRFILETYPNDPLAVDARYMIGESWERTEPDSAAAAFEAVARDHPDSPRAPSALYKLGSMALSAGKTEEARRYFQRVVAGYADSDEAELAQVRLDSFR